MTWLRHNSKLCLNPGLVLLVRTLAVFASDLKQTWNMLSKPGYQTQMWPQLDIIARSSTPIRTNEDSPGLDTTRNPGSF